jgi:hypothetical protein
MVSAVDDGDAGMASTTGENGPPHAASCGAAPQILERCDKLPPTSAGVRRDLCLRSSDSSQRAAFEGSGPFSIRCTPTPGRAHRIRSQRPGCISNWSGDFQIRIKICVAGQDGDANADASAQARARRYSPGVALRARLKADEKCAWLEKPQRLAMDGKSNCGSARYFCAAWRRRSITYR